MRIALVGFRGIPAAYGGFETLAEHVAPALAERGHDVTVYCRRRFNPEGIRTYRGVTLITHDSIPTKYLDTISHTLRTIPHILTSRYDALIVLNSINALACLPFRMAGIPTALNVDGIERRRRKWNAAGRAAYALSEIVATIAPHVVITDAASIRSYYQDRYGKESVLLTYGADLEAPESRKVLDDMELTPGRYHLYVGRFEPENHPDTVIRGHADSKARWPLVMLGDNRYDPPFVERLKMTVRSDVRFPGALYGLPYRELLFHAGSVVLAFEVGGTHPALVEAMGAGRAILLSDTTENREVAGEAALFFDALRSSSLAPLYDRIEREEETRIRLGTAASSIARKRYTWHGIVDGYERLLNAMVEWSHPC